jgi:hypothetical protein
MVMKPPITQTSIIHPAPPTVRDISALVRNIPDPIMTPDTSMIPSKSPRERLNVALGSAAFFVATGVLSAGIVVKVLQ